MEVATIPQESTARILIGTRAWLREKPEGERAVAVRRWDRPDPMTLRQWRAWFVRCLFEKINRGERPRGRKDCYEWLLEAQRCARAVNTPRLIVRSQRVPLEFRERLRARLTWPGEEAW